jgi:hypothetical protein
MSEALERQIGGNHYREMAIQPAEFIHKNGIGFLLGNAIKYACRYGKNASVPNGLEDLEKSRHYLDLMIEFEKNDTTS